MKNLEEKSFSKFADSALNLNEMKKVQGGNLTINGDCGGRPNRCVKLH